MRVATVTMPRDWEPCNFVVKQCLEFYTLHVAPQFQVNVRCDGGSGTIQVSDFGTLNEEQHWMLGFAVKDFNLYIKNNPSQDHCTAAIEYRKELDRRRNRRIDNVRQDLFAKVTGSADTG